jgi:CHAT domain-containing protein
MWRTRVTLRTFASITLLCGWFIGCAHFNQDTKPPADIAEILKAAQTSFDRGDFEAAIAGWEKAFPLLIAAGDESRQIDVLTSLGSAQISIGRYDLAIKNMTAARARAEAADDTEQRILALNALGTAYTFAPRAAMAGMTGMDAHADHHPPEHDPEAILKEALSLARETKDAHLQASSLNNLGNYFARSPDRYDDARAAYEKAGHLAEAADALLACRAFANAAVAASETTEHEAAAAFNAKARSLAERIADSHDKAFLLLTIGQTAEKLARLDAPSAAMHRKVARDAYERAITIANILSDFRARSYACGYLGAMALEEGRLDEAEQFTRRAMLAAQQGSLPDSLYRWQWQNARLLKARWKKDHSIAHLDASITFYDAATQGVQFIRNDIALEHGNSPRHSTFREKIGALYFEYADALLHRAQATQGDAILNDRQKANEVAALYLRAQTTVEQVKAVELENYFQDECVHLLKSKQKEVQDVDATTAVIYFIPLADRTEILVSFRYKQFFRAVSKLTAQQLRKLAERLHSQIADVDQADEFEPYQQTAQLLYKELIAPIRAELDARKIQTLVFVPDGALRTVPMSVLFDGNHHLIEDFAVAITPGLELLEPKAITRTHVQLLSGGLSVDRAGFKPLTYVPAELAAIGKFYPDATVLQDQNFIQPRLERAMEERPYSIVHVASHAVFGDDASKSFLLTFDGRMRLDDVERLLRPYQLRDHPVELLTLSACQCATTDDQEQAALGIAGIAVKAGARSAVAALWSVDEQATLELMTDFYAQLSRTSTDGKAQISKAQAMRTAQIKMLRGQRFDHPYHWAGFLVIGNWL